MIIEDGVGGGDSAEVKDNRLVTDSNTALAKAVVEKQTYSVYFEQDSGAITSDFFYLKNTSSQNLNIYQIRLFTPTLDVEVSVKTGVTGTPTSGTAIVPINLFTGGAGADVTCEGRDGDMALTGGDTVDILNVSKDFPKHQVWDYPAPITLPPLTAMVLYVNIDPTADIDGTLFFYLD